jgi:hypothetical protein
MNNMDQIIKQKFQPLSNEPILNFVSSITVSVFENSERITNSFRPHSKIQGMKYFQYANTIYGFSNLKKNWDSYNADTITQMAIDTAIDTLNHLHSKGFLTNGFRVNAFPMRDGGVQFEFDGKYICAELEISPNGEVTFILFDNDGDIVEEVKVFEISEIPTLLEDAQYA